MTVAELISDLQGMPEDMEVRISYDYGDYNHTEVAREIDTVEVEDIIIGGSVGDHLPRDDGWGNRREISEDDDTERVVIIM